MMPPNAGGDKDMRRAAGPAVANIKPARTHVSIKIRTAAALRWTTKRTSAPFARAGRSC